MKTLFVLAALWAVTLAADLGGDWRRDWAAVQESLRDVPPKYRAGWLRCRGLDDSYYTRYRATEDSGLRMIGKYGRGPAVEVTGNDSMVFLALGSEVAVVSVSDPQHPRVLSEVQLNFCPRQVATKDRYGSQAVR